MKYHFKIHKEQDGFWAECLELEGCRTQADSKEELLEMMEDALNTYLDDPDCDSKCAELPDDLMKVTRTIVAVRPDPKLAFQLLLRHAREQSGKTQHDMKKLLGYKSVNAYQRLERNSNPTINTMWRIKKALPELSLDRLFS